MIDSSTFFSYSNKVVKTLCSLAVIVCLCLISNNLSALMQCLKHTFRNASIVETSIQQGILHGLEDFMDEFELKNVQYLHAKASSTPRNPCDDRWFMVNSTQMQVQICDLQVAPQGWLLASRIAIFDGNGYENVIKPPSQVLNWLVECKYKSCHKTASHNPRYRHWGILCPNVSVFKDHFICLDANSDMTLLSFNKSSIVITEGDIKAFYSALGL